ncbi:MAG: DUF2953 domain-containing protein [Lachnospiraceae bacterium]|nr:DUF2953 domain-containing protein [Lachnospiraceae bacterium]
MILAIWKGIGIVLLALFGLLLLLLGLLLFVPICYRVEGTYHGALHAEAVVRFVPLLLKVQATVKDNRVEYVVRLLGGVVMTNTEQKLSWIGRKFFSTDDETADEDWDDEPQSLQDKSISNDRERTQPEVRQESDLPDGEERTQPEVRQEPDISDGEEQTQPEHRQQGLSNGKEQTVTDDSKPDRLDSREQKKPDIHRMDSSNGQKKHALSLWGRLRRKMDSAKDSIHRITEKVSRISKMKTDLSRVLQSKRFEAAKKDGMRYIRDVLRILKPKLFEGYIRFGLEDPAVTGEIFGGLALLYPLYQTHLTIEPDFTQSCLEGELKGKGTIFLCRIVVLAIQILLNKNLIKVTKKMQTIIES